MPPPIHIFPSIFHPVALPQRQTTKQAANWHNNMPFPVHPRAGHNSFVHPSSGPATIRTPSSFPSIAAAVAAFPGRNLLLALFSISLAISLLLILIFQLRPFDPNGQSGGQPFSEIRIKLEGGEEFAIFGRKLAVGNGDYFLDIPYANGTPRFQQSQLAPLPPNFYAIHHGNGCPNGFTRTKAFPDLNWNPPPLEPIAPSEQCQTLNIYRCTNSPPSQLVPVLVHLNEGDWRKRSNANLEPATVIGTLACNEAGPMLVVSINYRMGPFGHFHVPGWPMERRNFALWDIRTGLEWVQQNIVHFGGHRAHVTVLARGAGARLVSLLGILPQGKALFKRQILLSGSPFSPTLLQSNNGTTAPFDPSMHFVIAANCANEREWQELAKNGEEEGGGGEELRAKLEGCLAGMGTEAMVAAESRVRAPSFLHWPVITDGRQLANPINNFSIPDNPFLAIPPIPSIVGVCRGAGESEGTMAAEREEGKGKEAAYRRRLKEALREELSERLGQMGDLGRMKGDGDNGGGAEMVDHYLGAAMEGGKGGSGPERLLEKIRADFLLSGPALLDSFARVRLANARVHGFTFHPPPALTLSILDSAEVAAGQANPWASSQPACLDDLLFNPIPEQFKKQIAQLEGHFVRRMANFVIFGDPNAEGLEEWPNAFPREGEEGGGGEGGWKGGEDEGPKWMRMEEGGGGERMEEGKKGGGGGSGGGIEVMGDRRYWMCQVPRRMGMGELCRTGMEAGRRRRRGGMPP